MVERFRRSLQQRPPAHAESVFRAGDDAVQIVLSALLVLAGVVAVLIVIGLVSS